MNVLFSSTCFFCANSLFYFLILFYSFTTASTLIDLIYPRIEHCRNANRFKQLNSKTKTKKTPPSDKHIKLEDLNIGVNASSEPDLQ